MNMESFLLTLLGAFLGGLLSWGIAHLYYAKSKTLEKVVNNLAHSMAEISLRRDFAAFFSDEAKIPRLIAPAGRKKGEPYVHELRLLRQTTESKKTVSGIFRVIDEGWDHPVVGAASLRVLGKDVPLQYVGFGHTTFSFPIPEGDKAVTLVFALSDTKGNQTHQEIPIEMPWH